MPQHALVLGFVCTVFGIVGAAFDILALSAAHWTLWFLGAGALMAGGLWSSMRFTPMPDLMLRTAPIPVAAKGRPQLTLIQGGKTPRRPVVLPVIRRDQESA